VQWLADLQHHIVGGIDDVVDRPHPRQAQPPLHPIRARRDRYAFDQTEHEARVEFGFLNGQRHAPGERRAAPGNLKRRRPQTGSRQRRQLARDSDDVGVARQVGRQGDLQHGVAHVLDQGLADGRLGVEQDDAFVILGDPQLLFGAGHRVGVDAADLRSAQGHELPPRLVTIEKLCSLTGIGDLEGLLQPTLPLEWKQVRRAGEDDMFLPTVVQPAKHQPVGVGMRHDFPYRPNDDHLGVPGQACHLGVRRLAGRPPVDR
jgi:hypothetical protein